MTTNKPHIVKFSGGRSSGMMLLQMLQEGRLDPKRGDVVVFNNTSAEHRSTYEFTRKIKTLTEKKYNIPFFWIEFQTYEDAGRNSWQRKQTYRLVNEKPYSARNKSGYRYNGEVYEEMVSHSGLLPNMHNRKCTQMLKIFVTNAFLADWFAQKDGVERQGHFGEQARMSDADVINLHRKSRGATPDEILLKKREFVRGCDFVRQAAAWNDFTTAKLCFDNADLMQSVIGGKGQLYGEHAIGYVSCLGIRKDEEIRVEKIKARIQHANGNTFSYDNQPPKEEVIAPLVEQGVTREEVVEFWNAQAKTKTLNLNLPDSGLYSNCVYCPLKGRKKLVALATIEQNNDGINDVTPASINWWVDIERKYARNLTAEKRRKTSTKKVKYIGFFGENVELVFAGIKAQASDPNHVVEAEFLEDEDYMLCNCTD